MGSASSTSKSFNRIFTLLANFALLLNIAFLPLIISSILSSECAIKLVLKNEATIKIINKILFFINVNYERC